MHRRGGPARDLARSCAVRAERKIWQIIIEQKAVRSLLVIYLWPPCRSPPSHYSQLECGARQNTCRLLSPPNTGHRSTLHSQFFLEPRFLTVLGGNVQIDNRGRKSSETQQCRYITTGFNAQYNCYNFSNISAICCRKR